jgi:tRNA U54 and U55 pseudouridine synthase Pus10
METRRGGDTLALILVAKAHKMLLEKDEEGERLLEKLATNGFFKPAYETLKRQGIVVEEKQKECYLCRGRTEKIEPLTDKITQELASINSIIHVLPYLLNQHHWKFFTL